MTKISQNKIVTSLLNEGFAAEGITLTDGSIVVSVKLNYEGLYPTKEVFDKLTYLRNKYKKHYDLETRGHYTAVFIKGKEKA